ADHRVVAGVHFPIDATASRMAAETLAEYFAHRCGARKAGWTQRTFDGRQFPDDEWKKPFDRLEKIDNANGESPYFHENRGTMASVSPCAVVDGGHSLLHWLWDKAAAEWQFGPSS